MRFRLALALVVATIAPAVPAAEAAPPSPSLSDVLHLLPVSPTTVEDYCVWEVQDDGTRRKLACAPAGRLPVLESDILVPLG